MGKAVSPMALLPEVRGEIAFKSTARYTCPTCGFSTTIVPCVGCFARQAKERMKAGGGDRKSGAVNLPPPIPDQADARDAAGKAVAAKAVPPKTTQHAPPAVPRTRRGG
jgi:hypothetical protein